MFAATRERAISDSYPLGKMRTSSISKFWMKSISFITISYRSFLRQLSNYWVMDCFLRQFMMTEPAWHASALSYSGQGISNLASEATGRKTSFSPYRRSLMCFLRIWPNISVSQYHKTCRSSFTSSTSLDSSLRRDRWRAIILPNSAQSTSQILPASSLSKRYNQTLSFSIASFSFTQQCLEPSLATLFKTSLTLSFFSEAGYWTFTYFIHCESKNSYILYRLIWSLSRQAYNNSDKESDMHGEVGNLTLSVVTLLMKTTYPLSIGKGRRPKTSWKRMTPIDQISHFLSYGRPCKISGAMVIGVPQQVCIITSSPPAQRAKPKSASLIVKSFFSNTFANLMSLWAIPRACRCLKASPMHLTIFLTFSGGNRLSMFSLRYFSRSPLSQNSKTRQQLLGVSRVSCNLTM